MRFVLCGWDCVFCSLTHQLLEGNSVSTLATGRKEQMSVFPNVNGGVCVKVGHVISLTFFQETVSCKLFWTHGTFLRLPVIEFGLTGFFSDRTKMFSLFIFIFLFGDPFSFISIQMSFQKQTQSNNAQTALKIFPTLMVCFLLDFWMSPQETQTFSQATSLQRELFPVSLVWSLWLSRPVMDLLISKTTESIKYSEMVIHHCHDFLCFCVPQFSLWPCCFQPDHSFFKGPAAHGSFTVSHM